MCRQLAGVFQYRKAKKDVEPVAWQEDETVKTVSDPKAPSAVVAGLLHARIRCAHKFTALAGSCGCFADCVLEGVCNMTFDRGSHALPCKLTTCTGARQRPSAVPAAVLAPLSPEMQDFRSSFGLAAAV